MLLEIDTSYTHEKHECAKHLDGNFILELEHGNFLHTVPRSGRVIPYLLIQLVKHGQ